MRFRKWLLWCLSLSLIFLLTGLSWAQDEEDEEEPAGERPVLKVGVLPADFRLDGLVGPLAEGTDSYAIEDLITIEPEEGGEPQSPTIVQVFADKKNIVVVIRCLDDEPDKIVSFSKARDSAFEENFQEDHVVLVFDSFLDGRSGYVFAVNPSGARSDGLVIEHGEDVNSEWDAVWEAKTSSDDKGWYAEIRIPIKSLSFKKGLTEWGFNVQRRVQRLQETSRWSGASLDYEIYQTSRAGLLTELPEFDYGLGLSIRASTVGSGRTPGPDEDTEFDGALSLDVTKNIGSNLHSAFTVNTDFAETEVDVRQTNLTRFPRFFPEKRSFFLQGADIFEFGVALDEDNMIPFFSRRIGLAGKGEDNLAEIPIDFGGKINGRVGNTNIGAMLVNTRTVDSLDIGDVDEDIKINVPDATMGVLRIKQNILEESSIGLLTTFGDQLGRSNSWSAGVDFTYRTSNFMNEKNFLVGVWGMRNDRDDLEGDKGAYGFRIDYPNELIDLNVTSIRIGDGFEPSLAFVPRNDVHIWDFSGEYRPRPAWESVRQLIFELGARVYNTLDNSEWESYEVSILPVNFLLESGDSFNAGLLLQGDNPPESFEIASGVDIPSGEYDGSYTWSRFVVGANLAGKRRVSGNITWEFGDYYNGDLSTIEASLALKPSSFLNVELLAERNSGKAMALPEDVDEEDAEELVSKSFTEKLYGARVLLNFSPDLQISSLTQYDTESKELGTNTRLRWTFHPLGDIFIVYNHNMVRLSDEKRWEFVSNEFPLKIQYALRF
ncbi:MAG: carbohydrate binding family 9 domain-containing protein [Deferribacteres bacterium]|nr:carbohydrate binding family 9 domain-containing protein [candidate division KSB1 bacterium]MCB9511240.1 carbohydrate binding family 9 domain-containing protein [Deferribacteres bacterium]